MWTPNHLFPSSYILHITHFIHPSIHPSSFVSFCLFKSLFGLLTPQSFLNLPSLLYILLYVYLWCTPLYLGSLSGYNPLSLHLVSTVFLLLTAHCTTLATVQLTRLSHMSIFFVSILVCLKMEIMLALKHLGPIPPPNRSTVYGNTNTLFKSLKLIVISNTLF